MIACATVRWRRARRSHKLGYTATASQLALARAALPALLGKADELRKKLEGVPGRITTLRNVGYRFDS